MSFAVRTYRGNCHCGAFVYEAKLPEIMLYTECNCSICRKKGYANLIPEDFRVDVIKGSIHKLEHYTFNNGGFIHRFCADCGTAVLAQNINDLSSVKIMINARTVQNIDVWSLEAIRSFDGKSLRPPFEPTAYKGPEPAAKEGDKIYHGSCHYGAVTLAVKVDKPLEARDITVDEERIVECNCSVCIRGAYGWIYPHIDDTVIEGREHLSYCVINLSVLHKAFCKHVECMSAMSRTRLQLLFVSCVAFVDRDCTPDAEVETLSEDGKLWHDRIKTTRRITLRVLDDFDFKTVKTKKIDGWNLVKPLYVNP